MATIRKTRRFVADSHHFAVRHYFPQHHALRDGMVRLAGDKGAEGVVDGLHKRGVEGQFEGAAAEELAPVEARADVEQAVELHVGYHAAHICEGLEGEQVGEEGASLILGAVVEELRQHHGRIRWRRAGEGDEEGLVAVICSVEFIHKRYNLRERAGREHKRAREDKPLLRISLESEARDDAKVAPRAAYRPEEICVRGFRGGDDGPRGQDDFHREQVVNRQSVFAGQIAVAAAERQASDARVVDGAAHGCEAVGCARCVDVGPDGAALGGYGARCCVYGYASHLG